MKYPVLNSPRSFIECPVHGLAVALNAEGRIVSTCPGCLAVQVRARAKQNQEKGAKS